MANVLQDEIGPEGYKERLPPADPDAVPQVPLGPARRPREHGRYGDGTMEDAAIRQNRALELRMAGATYQQIADTLGYRSTAASYGAVQKALTKDTRRIGDARDEFRKITVARTERLIRAIWPQALAGDLFAVDRVLKIMERQAKLLGLDAPTQVTITDDTKTELQRLMGDLEAALIPGTVVSVKDETLAVRAAEELSGGPTAERGGTFGSDQRALGDGQHRREGGPRPDFRDWGLAAEGAAGELGPLPVADSAETHPDDGDVDDDGGPGDGEDGGGQQIP